MQILIKFIFIFCVYIFGSVGCYLNSSIGSNQSSKTNNTTITLSATSTYVNSTSSANYTVNGLCPNNQESVSITTEDLQTIASATCLDGNWYASLNFSTIADGSIRIRAVSSSADGVAQFSDWVDLVKDTLAPTAPANFNDMNYGSIVTSALMMWESSTDTGPSGFDTYQIAVGSATGGNDILDWQNFTMETKGQIENLNLTNGNVYYSSLRAIDKAGNISAVTSGNGWKAVSKWRPLESNSLVIQGNTNASVLQSDNKRLVGGQFSYVGGSVSQNLTRVNTDGSADTSFLSNAGFATDVTLQSDGKILLASPAGLNRVKTDGAPDDSFAVTGTGFNNDVQAVTMQPDGKILVGGMFDEYNGLTRTNIIRLNPDGSEDTSFYTEAMAATISYPGVTQIVVQSNGKILVGGGVYKGIIRLNADGTVDPSFSIAGTGFNDDVYAIALQSDGKILVGGDFTGFSGTGRQRMARLDATGTLDASFNLASGFNGNVGTIVVQPDGNILAGGSFTQFKGNNRGYLVRMDTNTNEDATFTTNLGTGFGGFVRDVKLQSDNKIVVVGDFLTLNGATKERYVRLNTNGTVDLSFVNGPVRASIVPYIYSLAIQADGKHVFCGSIEGYAGTSQKGLARINTDGTHDTTLNIGTGFSGFFSMPWVNHLNLQSDGKIIVGGDFTSFNSAGQNRLVRLTTLGAKDATFNVGTGFDSTVHSTVIQSDGKVIVGGSFTNFNGSAQSRLVRLTALGAKDATFNVGAGPSFSVRAMALQSDGKLLIGGGFATYDGSPASSIARVSATGVLDASFEMGTGFNSVVTKIVLLNDGKILVGGDFTTYKGVTHNRLVQLTSTGSVDTSFSVGTGFDFQVQDIVLLSDGKILVAGNFTTFNGISARALVKLNADGSLDTSFNQGTGFNYSNSSPTIYSLALFSDGKINACGGALFTYDGAPVAACSLLGW